MPCGHIFCTKCITEWLKTQCTCPVCRYELPTSDIEYEKERKSKPMRKAKYKREELKKMTVKELKSIMSACGIKNDGFSEKGEFVDAISKSDRIELIPDTEADWDVYYEFDLRSMDVERLRNSFKMFGLVIPNADENPTKDELIGLLLNSGKVRHNPPGYE